MQKSNMSIDLSIEWPTLLVAAVCYTMFAIGTVVVPQYSLAAGVVVTALSVTLHSSLQHEVLHGHPFRNQTLSDALVFPPLGLFVPYYRFMDTHLAHHRDPNLTDPYDDPESNFQDPKTWNGHCAVHKRICTFNNTLFGRMVIGPTIGLIVFFSGDIRAIWAGDRRIVWSYVHHLFGLILLFWWAEHYMSMPVWAYVLSAYLGMSILKIRTYLEHQAHEIHQARSVVIEDRGILSLLFLNNNLHSIHHAHPKVAWHHLPALYHSRREEFLKRNRGYRFGCYGEVFAKYLFRVKDPVPHPLMRDED